MKKMLRDLTVHKGHANRMMMDAIGHHERARHDPEILVLLHHIMVANRFWYSMWVGEPFDLTRELPSSSSLEALLDGYGELQRREEAWIDGIAEAELDRVIETPHIPGGRCTIAEGVVQVCLHSQGHRSQLAKMLRALGGEPPMTDFILWLAQTRSRPGSP